MPNRILRDSALDSDRIAAVDEGSEVLFYRLLMLADDFGRFDGRLSVIRGRAFALRQSITEKEIERRLCQLTKFQLISRYKVNNKPYIEIPRFGQRQRAEKSKFPEMTDRGRSNDGQLTDSGQTSAHVVVVEGVVEDVGDSGAQQKPEKPAALHKINGDESPILAKLPLRGGGEFEVRQAWVAELEPSYPDVKVVQTILEMKGWCLGNPDRMKTRKGIKRFITSWLQNEQEKGDA